MNMPAVTIGFSKKIFCFGLFLYGGGLIAILVTNLPLPIKFLIIVLLAANGRHYFRRYIFFRHPRSVAAFWRDSAGFWSVKLLSGDVQNAYLKQSSVVTQFLLVLSFYMEDRRSLTVFISPESVGKQEYRRLLIHLYHAKKSGE